MKPPSTKPPRQSEMTSHHADDADDDAGDVKMAMKTAMTTSRVTRPTTPLPKSSSTIHCRLGRILRPAPPPTSPQPIPKVPPSSRKLAMPPSRMIATSTSTSMTT
jgi:hypothetical protein